MPLCEKGPVRIDDRAVGSRFTTKLWRAVAPCLGRALGKQFPKGVRIEVPGSRADAPARTEREGGNSPTFIDVDRAIAEDLPQAVDDMTTVDSKRCHNNPLQFGAKSWAPMAHLFNLRYLRRS